MIIFIKVLLPAPLPPIIADTSPLERLKFIPLRTWLSPNDLYISLQSSNNLSSTTSPSFTNVLIGNFCSYSILLFFENVVKCFLSKLLLIFSFQYFLIGSFNKASKKCYCLFPPKLQDYSPSS